MRQAIAAVTVVFTLLACAEEPPSETRVPPEAGPLIEFRMVHDTAGPGLERVQHGGEVLYLDPRAVVSDMDLRAVRPSFRQDRLLLSIELEAEGARRLEHVSAENIGRRMALVVNGRVRSAPVIRSPVGDVDVPMAAAVEVRGDEAQRLAELIRPRWPEGETSDEGL